MKEQTRTFTNLSHYPSSLLEKDINIFFLFILHLYSFMYSLIKLLNLASKAISNTKKIFPAFK